MSQLLVRTLRRGWTGVELWNGNRESLGNLVRFDPEQPYPSQVRSRLRLAARHLLLWSWTNHARNRTRYRAAATEPRWSG